VSAAPSNGAVLALWLAHDPSASARAEFLRILVAARAAGRPVTLLDLRLPGVADDPPLTSSDQRHLDALTRDGAALSAALPHELSALLRSASSLLCLSSATRAGSPAVLTLDTELLAAISAPSLLAALRAAGQVVFARSASA
jgi:hypothetical protein